jgi:hypothetical protein
MAKGKSLIELTDEKFKTPYNRDVIEFIRVMNPFAHSDVGSRMMELVKGLEKAQYYCPAWGNLAYVVLHTEASRIFGIAYDMDGLAFRLPSSAIPDALADRGKVDSKIGEDWIRFDPWAVDEMTPVTLARLKRWCEVAYRHALEAQ